MISVIYCTKESKPHHREHIIKSSGLHKHIDVIEIINNGESLTKCYNEGINQAKFNTIVICHDDIIIETKQWGKKLLKIYENNPEYSIIGVAGTKELSKSGRWWDNKQKMYGRVKHTHNNKSWLSTYSDDLGNNVEEVALVDGLWFSFQKDKIKTTFNEEVKGFHFYDVTFCVENKLLNCKIGVITKIRINHMSMGVTNVEWEENRKLFVKNNEESLPLLVNETFENRKLKVLLGCMNYNGLTGSEISTFELSKSLKENGCDVHVYSNIGGILEKKAKKLGIKLHPLDTPPGYKKGDGNWMLNVNGKAVPSDKNKLYKIKDINFDIIQINHQPIGKALLNLFPNNKFVNIVRSRTLPVEYPIIDSKIKKYIAISEPVKDCIIEKFKDIKKEDIETIYNITEDKKNNSKDLCDIENFILLPGTMNYLRKKMVYDITEKTKLNKQNLILVGNDSDFGYAKKISEENDHVTYYEEMEDLSELYEKCEKVCGSYLGRTLIEGFKYNKKGIGYLVNPEGDIEDILEDVFPKDVNLFKTEYITQQYVNLYKDVINSGEEKINNPVTIEQMRVAPGLNFFKEKLLKKYKLKEYKDINKPCIFNGMYTIQDYHALINHKSHKTIVWCGSDAQFLNKELISRAGKIRHIAKSKFISETLDKQDIPHILLPITPTIANKNYKEKKGKNIYFYSGEDRVKYGGDLVDIIKEKTNYNIIEANAKTFNEKELEKIYEDCFMGLRLTKHDGLPNTVLELGLMGRHCVHNGNTPNSLNYTTVEDIITHIDNEYNKRNVSSENIVNNVYDFLKINNDWLDVYDGY